MKMYLTLTADTDNQLNDALVAVLATEVSLDSMSRDTPKTPAVTTQKKSTNPNGQRVWDSLAYTQASNGWSKKIDIPRSLDMLGMREADIMQQAWGRNTPQCALKAAINRARMLANASNEGVVMGRSAGT
tara:strand:+ start:1725 stop:2114 length:390 start_codon:yes stop_codon:yes gene_type:complete